MKFKTRIINLKSIFLICLLSIFLYSPGFAESKKLIVLLDWFVNPDHAPLFVAESQGFFKQAGLDVELIGPADPNDPPKLVAAGKADIAITYQPQFMQQVDQGLPLIRIGTLIDRPLTCLAVLEKGSIRTIKDLQNKTIGYSGDTNSVTLKTILEKNAISPESVKLINVHYDLALALLSKKVDAVTGIMRNFELVQMELAGYPARAFYPEDHGVPTYSELIFIANKNNIQDPRLPKFIGAVKKGREFLVAHPNSAWLAFVKIHPELNNELNKQVWFKTIPFFAKDPAVFNKEQWLNFAEFLLKNGLVKQVQPIKMYAIQYSLKEFGQ